MAVMMPIDLSGNPVFASLAKTMVTLVTESDRRESHHEDMRYQADTSLVSLLGLLASQPGFAFLP